MASTPQTTGVYIANLASFRRDLKRAIGANPVALTAAIKAAGKPVGERAQANAAPTYLSGALQGGYSVSARGARGSVVNKVPYAAGAEWGQQGKWAGFMKYGDPGRFAWKAVDEGSEEIAAVIMEGLREIVEIFGWAH